MASAQPKLKRSGSNVGIAGSSKVSLVDTKCVQASPKKAKAVAKQRDGARRKSAQQPTDAGSGSAALKAIVGDVATCKVCQGCSKDVWGGALLVLNIPCCTCLPLLTLTLLSYCVVASEACHARLTCAVREVGSHEGVFCPLDSCKPVLRPHHVRIARRAGSLCTFVHSCSKPQSTHIRKQFAFHVTGASPSNSHGGKCSHPHLRIVVQWYSGFTSPLFGSMLAVMASRAP